MSGKKIEPRQATPNLVISRFILSFFLGNATRLIILVFFLLLSLVVGISLIQSSCTEGFIVGLYLLVLSLLGLLSYLLALSEEMNQLIVQQESEPLNIYEQQNTEPCLFISYLFHGLFIWLFLGALCFISQQSSNNRMHENCPQVNDVMSIFKVILWSFLCLVFMHCCWYTLNFEGLGIGTHTTINVKSVVEGSLNTTNGNGK